MSAYLGSQAIKVLDKSKNLIPFPYLFTETTARGVTHTANADGSITLDGVCTQTGNLDIQKNIPVKQGDVLTINSTSPQNWDTWYIMVSALLGGTFKKNYFGNKLTNKIVIDVECDNIVIRLTSYAGIAFENLNFKFSVCAGEETEIAPYNRFFRFRTGAMIRNPKNLIPFPYHGKKSDSSAVEMTPNTDGSILVNGATSASGYAIIRLYNYGEAPAKNPFVAGKTYTINCKKNVSSGSIYFIISYRIKGQSGYNYIQTEAYVDALNKAKFTWKDSVKYFV